MEEIQELGIRKEKTKDQKEKDYVRFRKYLKEKFRIDSEDSYMETQRKLTDFIQKTLTWKTKLKGSQAFQDLIRNVEGEILKDVPDEAKEEQIRKMAARRTPPRANVSLAQGFMYRPDAKHGKIIPLKGRRGRWPKIIEIDGDHWRRIRKYSYTSKRGKLVTVKRHYRRVKRDD